MDQMTISNMALGRIGISQFIQSPTELTNQAITCNIFYENCRDRVLTAFPWNFANAIVPLNDIGNPPNDWQFRYRYPNDCLKVLWLSRTHDLSQCIHDYEEKLYPYKVLADSSNNAKAIVTNLSTPYLWYTSLIVNLDLWTPEAQSALAWLLGTEIAGPLSAQPQYTKLAGDAYTLAIREAGSTNMNEGTPRNERECDLLTARY